MPILTTYCPNKSKDAEVDVVFLGLKKIMYLETNDNQGSFLLCSETAVS